MSSGFVIILFHWLPCNFLLCLCTKQMDRTYTDTTRCVPNITDEYPLCSKNIKTIYTLNYIIFKWKQLVVPLFYLYIKTKHLFRESGEQLDFRLTNVWELSNRVRIKVIKIWGKHITKGLSFQKISQVHFIQFEVTEQLLTVHWSYYTG